MPTPVVEVFLLQNSNKPNPSHVLFRDMDENGKAYGKFIQNENFMGTGKDGFVTYVTQALNN